MKLKFDDKLFVFYDDNKIPQHGKYSYFGNNFGSVDGFKRYIDGYIFAVQAIYNDYISCSNTQIDKLDTLIYPLCFNYRHVVELYIKYLYFKYVPVENDKKINFVKSVSHKLNKAWIETKPYLIPLLSKVKSDIDITFLDKFIDEIDDFDTDSFRMRYPIKKDLSSVHPTPEKLDVIGLNNKMMGLFELFNELDNEIDNVLIDNKYDTNFENRIKNHFVESKDEILSILNSLNTLANQEQHYIDSSNGQFESVINFDEIQGSPVERTLENDICQLPTNTAAILALTTQIGRFVSDGRCKLATNENERYKDILKLAEIALEESESFISFDGKYPNAEMCYAILEKGYTVTSGWLTLGVHLLESCFSAK